MKPWVQGKEKSQSVYLKRLKIKQYEKIIWKNAKYQKEVKDYFLP
jgi:hypothetical protein